MVDDEAAQVLAEEFYATLSTTGSDFRSAFERAKWELRLNQWVIDDDRRPKVVFLVMKNHCLRDREERTTSN